MSAISKDEPREMNGFQWSLQQIRVLGWMHSRGVAFQSLHARNVMIVTDPAHPTERNVIICDFGKANWLRLSDDVTQEDIDSMKVGHRRKAPIVAGAFWIFVDG